MEDNELQKIFNAKKEVKYLNNQGETITRAGFTSSTTFLQFKTWFNQDSFDQGCHYCHTTNKRSLELFNLRKYATRGGKRGKRLELDRRDPLQPYDNLENLVWCCYWCNNAKSNFFSEKESQPIADAIGKVLNNIS